MRQAPPRCGVRCRAEFPLCDVSLFLCVLNFPWRMFYFGLRLRGCAVSPSGAGLCTCYMSLAVPLSTNGAKPRPLFDFCPTDDPPPHTDLLMPLLSPFCFLLDSMPIEVVVLWSCPFPLLAAFSFFVGSSLPDWPDFVPVSSCS